MTDRKQNEPPLGLYDAKQREAKAKQREEKAREFGITVEELDQLGYRELDQLDDRKVIVTDIQMPFGSMVVFMVKWVIASIPALIILAALGFAVMSFLGSLINSP